MHTALRITLLVLGCAAFGAAAQQQSVATLTSLEGTVLVSDADAISSAKPQQRLADGARVLTTAGSKATITFDDGCKIVLDENQRLVIHRARDCRALLASVEQVAPSAGASRTAGFVPVLLPAAAAAGIAGAIIYRDKKSVTPN